MTEELADSRRTPTFTERGGKPLEGLEHRSAMIISEFLNNHSGPKNRSREIN